MYNQRRDLEVVLYSFFRLLDSKPIHLESVFMTLFTGSRHIINGFAYRAQSIQEFIFCFVIPNTDTTLFALRDMTTRCTENSWCVPCLIRQKKYFFLFCKMFTYRLFYQFTKISLLVFHINEINWFMGMLKQFVIHRLRKRWKCYCSRPIRLKRKL